MNINDYTYHLCDRFILLFIAFVGLVGTSYILVNVNATGKEGHIKSYSLGGQHSNTQKKIDNYTIKLEAAAPGMVVSGTVKADEEENLGKNKLDIENLEYEELASNPN